MINDVSNRESRLQQGETPDLCDQYRAIGIPAISAAALCNRRKTEDRQQSQSASQHQYFDYQD